jgi:heme/copper-type cytochrome/quinol oxidase subunit 4
MRVERLNRISGNAVIVLSLIALLAVCSGFFQAPQADEGSSAHIFQLAIVALLPMILFFLGTANWKEPWRSVRPLALSAIVLVVAFTALFYLEHYFYPVR